MLAKGTKYGVLIQQYKNFIYSYAMYMLKNKMDADDVTQEVLIRIWNNIEGFKYDKAKAWIGRTTHNLCIDYLRKRSGTSYKEISIEEEWAETYDEQKEEYNPYKKVHISMMTDKVKEAIKELPENLRSVFVLYEIEGLKYKEISGALDIPLNSVKVYLMRARKKLQEELKTYEPQEVL